MTEKKTKRKKKNPRLKKLARVTLLYKLKSPFLNVLLCVLSW